MENDIEHIPRLIAQLYQTVHELNERFRGRPFTPDGHLVGSIGEVVAAYTYGLKLEKCSNEGFDAKTEEDKTVEIKLTGGESVAVSSDFKTPPDFLLVLKLFPQEGFEEIYNGPFPREQWDKKNANKRRLVTFRLNELRKLGKTPDTKRLGEKHPLEELNRLFRTAHLLEARS